MKRLYSVERTAVRKAHETLWRKRKLFWEDLRFDPETRNHLIAQEILDMGYPVTWVKVGEQMLPQVFLH